MSFETAPFKLTRELLEVMDSNSEGRPSEMFDYFKVGPQSLHSSVWCCATHHRCPTASAMLEEKGILTPLSTLDNRFS